MEVSIFHDLVTPNPRDNLTADELAMKEELRLANLDKRAKARERQQKWLHALKARITAARTGNE